MAVSSRHCPSCDVIWGQTRLTCPNCNGTCKFRTLDDTDDMVEHDGTQYVVDELVAWSKINHDNFELYYQEREIARARDSLDTILPDDFALA